MLPGQEGIRALVNSDAVAESARTLSARPLCDRCLGRLYSKRFRGVDHTIIGERLRKAHGLDATDEESCFLCRGLFKRVNELALLPVSELGNWEFDTLWVGSRLEFGTKLREEEILSLSSFPDAEQLKVEVNRELGRRLTELLGKEGMMTNPDMLVIIDTAFRTYSLEPAPLFIYGRYRKLIRGIPQTKWPCRKCHGRGCSYCDHKGKMYETSVEELIAPELMQAAGAEQHFFHGMGREDIDAVMLGSGRPFVLELTRPRGRRLDLQALQEQINTSRAGQVSVSHLRLSTREEVRELKSATPMKRYVITFRVLGKINKQLLSEVISKLSGSRLSQRTPLRVVHRRADIVRGRTVSSCRLIAVDDETATLEIEAESGTYIKEFITGDEGRTVPSISGSLGMRCEVVTLDVSEISTGAGEKW